MKAAGSPDDDDPRNADPTADSEYYEQLQERLLAERPSRKRQSRPKRASRPREERRVQVRGERLDQPDITRLSRALLAAQREIAKTQAEADARNQDKDGKQ